ncbi:MAG: hypothetical protein AB1679_33835 [Actinomycetota bacterium]|jgi:hypothetical protein
MDNRRPITTHDGDRVDETRRSNASVNAKTAQGLRSILRRARGWTCDVRGVALDDQSGKLHVPLLEKADRRSPSRRVPAGELIVHRVEEFLVEGAATRSRWFELDGLAYEPATGRLTIASDGRSQFAVTVDTLEVTLRIRPQTRPPS